MKIDSHEGWVPAVTGTDLAREHYLEELLENSRRRLARLHTRTRTPAAPRITMDFLLEETIALQAERELNQLKKRSQIL